MSRIWINYKEWEDHRAGLYSKNKQDESVYEMTKKMFEVPAVFFELAMQMVSLWPNSADHNLSYFKSNRRSYLGQTTACFYSGANIVTTCKVWEKLTQEQRDRANMIADLVIEYYDQEVYSKKNVEFKNEDLS